MNNRIMIKEVFKGKAFQFVWLVKIMEIAPTLIFDNVSSNRESEGGWILIFRNKMGDTIEFIVTDDENDPEYGDMLSIHDTSNVDLNNEIQMTGYFFNEPASFHYSVNEHIQQLKKALDKFANLK